MLTLYVRLGLIASGIGITGFYGTVLMNYAFEALQNFAFLLVILIGFWVAGWIFLANYLTGHSHAVLQLIGDVIGAVMMYTGLFQGILYTALVFMVIGSTAGFGELAETTSGFVYDLAFAMGYLGVFIFGASSLTILFTYYRLRNRLLALLYGVVSVAGLLMALLSGADIFREIANRSLVIFTVGFVGYLLFWSILFMAILTTKEDPMYQKKVALRQRLRSRQGNSS